MQTQDVDRHSSRRCQNEALASHEQVFAHGACSFFENPAMMESGCTQVTLTSPGGRLGTHVPLAPVSIDKRDRRNTCRTASRAFSQLALWPLSQLAHSPHRKNSSLSSPSRFRLSRSSPANTSNLIKVIQGQATAPVPLLAQWAKTRKAIDLGQRGRLPKSDTCPVGDLNHGQHIKPEGEDLCFTKQEQHSVLPQFLDWWPVASRNHRHLSASSQISQNTARPFALRGWSCPAIFVSRPRPRPRLPLPVSMPAEPVEPLGGARAVRIRGPIRGRTPEQVREPGLDRAPGRDRGRDRDQAPVLGQALAAHRQQHKFHNHSSILQAAAGWVTALTAAVRATS